MTTVIDIEGLCKRYPGGVRALDGLDLSVAEGEIHGLLGPNASGKTTVLRALLGLVRADAGRIRIFDREIPRGLPRVVGAVGAVLDEPRFFPGFTARRTLKLLATAAGVKRRRVSEVLAQVGLSGNAAQRVGSYSRGMAQRLALAAALLKEPQLLILDEPCAGLDPSGVAELRTLLRTLADRGVTVLISSHVLTDVQRLCDTVTIVSRGRRIATGPVAALRAGHDKGDVRVRTTDLTAAAKLMADAGLPVEVYDDHMIVSDIADPAWITEALGRKRLWVGELTPLPPDLDSVYLSVAGGMPTSTGPAEQLTEPSSLHGSEAPAAPAEAADDTPVAQSSPAAAPATTEPTATAAPTPSTPAPAVAEEPVAGDDTATQGSPPDVTAGAPPTADDDNTTTLELAPVSAPPISAPPMSPVTSSTTPPADAREPAAEAHGAEPSTDDGTNESTNAAAATAAGREEVRP